MKLKKIILSALFLFMFFVESPSQAELIAYWPLDKIVEGKVLDATGNGYDGTIVGDLRLSDCANRKGLYFDGGVNYIDCGSDGFDKIVEQITISAWIRIREFDKRTQTIVSKDDDIWQLHRGWGQHLDSVYFNVKAADGETVRHSGVMGQIDVNDGKWHHIVGVYTGDELKLYIDGQLNNTESARVKKISRKKRNFTIGDNLLEGKVKEDSKYSISWHGDISEVSVFDDALTPCQVGLLYNTDAIICEKYCRYSDLISKEDIGFLKNIPEEIFNSYIVCKQLARERKYSQAIDCLDKFIEANSVSHKGVAISAFVLKCGIYLQQDEIEKAFATLQALQKMYPDYHGPEFEFALAYCHMKKGSNTKAQNLLLQIISNYPQSSYALKARVCLRRIEEK